MNLLALLVSIISKMYRTTPPALSKAGVDDERVTPLTVGIRNQVGRTIPIGRTIRNKKKRSEVALLFT